MADHLTDVVDETVNHETAVHTSRLNGQDESELGEKYRVDRRKLEQMLQGITNYIYFHKNIFA